MTTKTSAIGYRLLIIGYLPFAVCHLPSAGLIRPMPPVLMKNDNDCGPCVLTGRLF